MGKQIKLQPVCGLCRFYRSLDEGHGTCLRHFLVVEPNTGACAGFELSWRFSEAKPQHKDLPQNAKGQ